MAAAAALRRLAGRGGALPPRIAPPRPPRSAAAGARGLAGTRQGGAADSSGTLPRFYQRAEVVAHPEAAGPDGAGAPRGGWGVALDQKILRSPGKLPLRFPTRALAAAVAAEWQLQGEQNVRPFTMPLMQLVATAIDRVPASRGGIVTGLMDYLDTDAALCREPAGTPAAVAQEEGFAPVLSWARAELGLRPRVSDMLTGTPQETETRDRLTEELCRLDDLELVAVDQLAGACRSLLLALAATRGAVGVQECLRLARLEEELQIEEWGMVEGGHDIDRADAAVRVAGPILLVALLRGGGEGGVTSGEGGGGEV